MTDLSNEALDALQADLMKDHAAMCRLARANPDEMQSAASKAADVLTALRQQLAAAETAALERAADIFHDEQIEIWSDEILMDMALADHIRIETFEDKVAAKDLVQGNLKTIADAIRALITPEGASAPEAVKAEARREAVKVKPLVWKGEEAKSYRQSNCILGQYQVSWLGEFECWQLSRPHKQGVAWKDGFSRHDSRTLAMAAAQADYEARILAALAEKGGE
ncbi:hypothetical protein [Neotabrizicola sp. VNH66]|uniref:hypothetical protein n=1 Tax=Neotabrizicola sp. VNH66 TaxID=3400918 RepID=UPI003C0396EA